MEPFSLFAYLPKIYISAPVYESDIRNVSLVVSEYRINEGGLWNGVRENALRMVTHKRILLFLYITRARKRLRVSIGLFSKYRFMASMPAKRWKTDVVIIQGGCCNEFTIGQNQVYR